MEDSIKTDNSSSESVEEFKCVGTTLTSQNSIQEEIKSRLKSGNAFYHSVQIKIYRTILLSAVVNRCEKWLLTMEEEHRLRVFENRMLRRISGPKKSKVTGEWRKLHNEELHD